MRTNLVAAWVMMIVIALSLAHHEEDGHRERAQRLDLKIMTLELKGNARVVDRMGRWRNSERRQAETWEVAVLLLSLAAAIGAIALSIDGRSRIVFAALSVAPALGAGYVAAFV